MMPGERLDAVVGQLQSGTVGGRLAGSRDREPPRQGTRYDPPAFHLVDVLSDAIPPQVDPNGTGSAGVGALAAREDHVHGLPLSTLAPTQVDANPAAPGSTGEVADAGHRHPFDPEAAGIPPWAVDATPDTLALRNPQGQIAAAPGTAPAHAATWAQVALAPDPNTIPVRTPAGQVQTAESAAGSHAIAQSQASTSPTPGSIMQRGPAGETEVGPATAPTHAIPKEEAETDAQNRVNDHADDTGNNAVHGSTALADPFQLVRRTNTGTARFADPTNVADAATMGWAQTEDAKQRGQVATFTVAAEDSRAGNQNAADYVAGSNAALALQAAINALDEGFK